MKKFLFLVFFASLVFAAQAQMSISSGAVNGVSSPSPGQGQQTQPRWDDTSKSSWPAGFEIVKIPSSADGEIQLAYLHKATRPGRPLIVSLHTWSGDYSQMDPLVGDIVMRDYNYIHPDFRGRNDRPEACGSPLTLSDLQDAIEYAVRETAANSGEVHIIGTSGGGYMALLAYLKLPYPAKSFSAWAPISDLEAWYWESVGRKQKYADDILVCVSKNGEFDDAAKAEARFRSPLRQNFSDGLRKGRKLYIYEGIHDGYTGSVPITHSLRMYNRLGELMGMGLEEENGAVSDREMLDLVTRRYDPNHQDNLTIGGRAVYLQRMFLGRDGQEVRLTVFEGGHEQLDAQALALIDGFRSGDGLRIFAIGDSNGANPGGWVDQLRAELPYSRIVNNSQGGRTIGFVNNGRVELNALANIGTYLSDGQKALDPGTRYDFIILCLGTNDTKADFANDQQVVPANFEKLLKTVLDSPLVADGARVIVVSPPPMGIDNMADKYVGGNDRLGALVPQMEAVARKYGCPFVDIYHPLQSVFRSYAEDGVHMTPAGQRIAAGEIIRMLNENLPVGGER
ncbi:MAG: GDSL-type esterase/lipase family protein [Rikenellaceae bacterium]|jgi:lysophospholipase L1-like esterase/pimeloyl-ACP methyl ester carboxylesterase|nr:GDSL-type esterase/lipase family protein [Rikenellaceae bacterium]